MSVESTAAYMQAAARDDLPPLASGGLVRCYGPLIYLAMRLRDGEAPAKDPAQFRQSVIERLDGARNMALQAGFHRGEVGDADFAVTALIDETIMVREGGLRDSWAIRTLQHERYGTQDAGERFFKLLKGEGGSGSPRVELMELYLLCLMAGFAGKYQADPTRLRRLTEGLQAALRTKQGEVPRALSPNTASILPRRKKKRAGLPSAWLVFAACVFFVILMGMLSSILVSYRAEEAATVLEERTDVLESGEGRP